MMTAKETSRSEGRPRPSGIPHKRGQVQTQRWVPLHSNLVRVNDAAQRSRQCRFTALFHHLDVAALERAFRRQRRRAAPGVDGMTVAEYEKDLGARLEALWSRLQTGRYRPNPVRRTYIPKADGSRRPLGITALEDKIVQSAVAEILSSVYEVDFHDCSFGFRPGRSAHDALRTVHGAIMSGRVNWVIDADIRNFFGSVDHSWMERMLAHRIADPRILRLVRLWLQAGVLEDGVFEETPSGTPQGSGISPILANIYLHYVLDLWVAQWVRRHARRPVRLVRFADDYLLLCEGRDDAVRLMEEMRQRLAKFRLSLHEGKTRLVEFGRFARTNRQRRGLGRPETFDFLGFTLYCGATRSGSFMVKLKTQRTRMIRKLKELRVEMKKRRHHSIAEQKLWLGRVLRGHYAYFGITGNSTALAQFHTAVVKWWRWVLRRRGQRPKLPWERFNAILRSHPLPSPRIVHNWRYQPRLGVG